jgi:hypothetical protein
LKKPRCPNYGKQMVEIVEFGAKELKNMGYFSGGCQCGAVRFHIKGPLGKAGICHCRMCQKAFGSWGAALVSVPANNLSWTREQPADFRSSAIVARGFCAGCGTPLYMHEDGDDIFELAIGAFDNPSDVGPLAEQAGIESRVSWFNDMHRLPEQTTAETRSPRDLAKLKSLQHPDHDTEHWP